MERLTKKEEMYFKYETIRELEKVINEVEMTLDEDGEITNRFIDGQYLLYCLKDVRYLLLNYYANERR